MCFAAAQIYLVCVTNFILGLLLTMTWRAISKRLSYGKKFSEKFPFVIIIDLLFKTLFVVATRHNSGSQFK